MRYLSIGSVALVLLFATAAMAIGTGPESVPLPASEGAFEPFATCTPTEVALRGAKSAENPVFTWTATAPWTVSGYAVLRSTSPIGLRQTAPYAELAAGTLTYTDTAATADLLFYEIVPRSTFFTLEWAGPFSLPADPEVTTDGFKPTPVVPYGAPEDVALSGDPAEFWVDARSLMGCVPTAVELLVDRNDDGDYADPGEVVPMTRLAPDPPVAADSLYRVSLDVPLAKGTPPTPTSILYARDAAGQTRWAKSDGAGTITYRFRAWDGSAFAMGPASADKTLTLLNTAKELIEELGLPVVEAGAGSPTTDWQTALKYFEEAEARVAPTSPFNQAAEPERHPDYLNALLCATLAETGYTYAHYRTLFQGDPDKPYRDVALDWAAFAAEQTARMTHLAAWAEGQTWPFAAGRTPAPAWQRLFPAFAWYFEEAAGGGGPLFIFDGRGGTAAQLLPPPAGLIAPAFSAAGPASVGAGRAPFAADPIYTFPASEWDRADAYALKAYYQGIHAAAAAYRIYENPAASRLVKVSDLDAIETWLKPEADAKAHAQCSPTPCPPLNGLDDDADGLVDDLGYSARLFEEFDGLGIYAEDPANNLSLRSVANDLADEGAEPGEGGAMDSLRQAFRTMAAETDDQSDDALLVYIDVNGNGLFDFTDVWDYRTRAAGTDGLPDLAYGAGDYVPAGFCPVDPTVPEPVTLKGGLGDDLKWWVDQVVKAYNKAAGTTYDPACYPEVWGYTVVACDWGHTLERGVAGDHFNWRSDVEQLLLDNGIDPADLGPDFQTFLVFLQDVDPSAFIDGPENVRNYLPYFCSPHEDPACANAQTYSFNGFWGDWDEPVDPIVPGKFWTIEPFSTFNWDGHGILAPACDPASLNTDSDCVAMNWIDSNGNGKFDLFERLLMANASTPQHYLDLNGDGQWNGWIDRLHDKRTYVPADGQGAGLYNFIYVYFQDPTFGGRFPGVTNESLNNFLGAAAGWSDGLLENPSNNHHPVGYTMVEEPPTAPGANVRFRVTATDADGDTIHFYLAIPEDFAGAGGSVVVDGRTTGVYELSVPMASGTWGFVGVAYDNVNNLSDLVGSYLTVSR